MSAARALVSSEAGSLPPFRDRESSGMNSNVLKSIQCLACNIFFEMDGASRGVVAIVNVPLRLGNMWRAAHRGIYWQVGLDTLAIASLVFPEGLAVSIALDFASIAVSTYEQTFPFANEELYDKKPRDCSTLEASREVLGLSEEEAQDQARVERRYNELCNQWDKRINEAGSSIPLLQRFQRLKYEAGQAYATIRRQNEPQGE